MRIPLAALAMVLGGCSDPAEQISPGTERLDAQQAAEGIAERTYELKGSHVVLTVRSVQGAADSFELWLRCPRVIGAVESGSRDIILPTVAANQAGQDGCTAADISRYDELRRLMTDQGALTADAESAKLFAGGAQIATFQPEVTVD